MWAPASPDAPEKSSLSTVAEQNIELEGAPVAPSSSSNAVTTAKPKSLLQANIRIDHRSQITENPDIGHCDKDRDTAVVKRKPPHEPVGMQSAVTGGRQGPKTTIESIVLWTIEA